MGKWSLWAQFQALQYHSWILCLPAMRQNDLQNAGDPVIQIIYKDAVATAGSGTHSQSLKVESSADKEVDLRCRCCD